MFQLLLKYLSAPIIESAGAELMLASEIRIFCWAIDFFLELNMLKEKKNFGEIFKSEKRKI